MNTINPIPNFNIISPHLQRCRTCNHHRTSSSSDLVSDGVDNEHKVILRLIPFLPSSRAEDSEACEQTYGFMPCSTTGLGNLFLILVYGYLMSLAATYLSADSEVLLEILGPGLVGGLLLPVLGALLDWMLILGKQFHNSNLADYYAA